MRKPKRPTLTLPYRVGRYVIGGCAMELWATNSDSGEGESGWTKTGWGKIKVGINTESWSLSAQILVHEFVEIAFHVNRLALQPDNAFRLQEKGTDTYRYFMDHQQFSHAIGEAADALVHALPDFARVWNRYNKQRD